MQPTVDDEDKPDHQENESVDTFSGFLGDLNNLDGNPYGADDEAQSKQREKVNSTFLPLTFVQQLTVFYV